MLLDVSLALNTEHGKSDSTRSPSVVRKNRNAKHKSSTVSLLLCPLLSSMSKVHAGLCYLLVKKFRVYGIPSKKRWSDRSLLRFPKRKKSLPLPADGRPQTLTTKN